MRAPLSQISEGLGDEESGDEENLSRIWILHFLAGSVAGDVNVAAAGIKRAKDVTRFAGDRLGGGNLRLSRSIARRGGRRLRFLRNRGRRRFWAGARLGGSGSPFCCRRGRRDVPAWRGDRVRTRRGRSRRSGLRVAVDVVPDVVSRRVDNVERTDRNVVGRAATAENSQRHSQKSDAFHALLLCAISVVAREFLTSATNSSICVFVVDHAHMKRCTSGSMNL